MSTTLEQIQYGFNRDSRRIWRQRATTQGWDNAYVYDSLSQVVSDDRGDLNLARNAIAGTPGNGARWQYDETGNWHGYQLLENGADSLTQSRMHDKGNRLMQVSDAAEMRTDRAGRMLETVPGPAGDWGSSYQITWDAWSRITAVASVAGETVTPAASYAYDGLTRRITRHTDAEDVTMHSYYSEEWRPVEERKGSETTAAASYLWGSRHRDDLVRRDRAVVGTTLNESRYILMDYFSPASIADENGTITERYQFSAFGIRTILNPDYTLRSTSECAMEFAFQGQFEDTETGWLNYGYRYYLPSIGRWACKDPIEERGGFNLYLIVENDSVNQADHLGLIQQGSGVPDSRPPSDPPRMPNGTPMSPAAGPMMGMSTAIQMLAKAALASSYQEELSAALAQCDSEAFGSPVPIGCGCCLITIIARTDATGAVVGYSDGNGDYYPKKCDDVEYGGGITAANSYAIVSKQSK